VKKALIARATVLALLIATVIGLSMIVDLGGFKSRRGQLVVPLTVPVMRRIRR
jgi:hypothetical protein